MGPELWIVIGVIALVAGPTQLPKLARALGSAKKELDAGMNNKDSSETSTKP